MPTNNNSHDGLFTPTVPLPDIEYFDTSVSWIDTVPTVSDSAKLSLKGENADIEIGDKSLMSILDAIESRLGLVKFNPELEAEFEELRRIGDEYRATEKRMLEKRKLWETLKR